MPGTFRNGRPTIGVVAGWQYYWTATPLSYLNPIYHGIRFAAQEQGCNLLLGCGLGPSAAASDPLRPAWPTLAPDADFVPIGPWNTTGLIAVCPLHSDSRSQDLQQFMHSGHPLVFVGSGENGPTVAADNAGGIQAAVAHLVEHGHRHIAFLAGSPEDLAGDTGARLKAYHAAVQRFGLTADARLVAYGRHISTGGYHAMQQIMATSAPFTAVLASNDESALGAMQALKAAGRRIPADVALIGFDDRPESAIEEPALSSVHVSLFDMGYRAVMLLLQQIAGAGAPTALVKASTRLICRASCGCGRKESYTEQKKIVPQSVTSVAATPEQLVQRMADAVLTATQRASFTQLHAHCQRLYSAFLQSVTRNDGAAFLAALATTLQQSPLDHDDAHGWQAAISQLRDELPNRWPDLTQSELRRAETFLDQARVAISAAIWQEQQRTVSAERWTTERIGRLTAHLLTALDETQVYQVLAHHLPAMGIHTAWVAHFVGENADPVAWSDLRVISPANDTTNRIASRAFPPAPLLPGDQPFSLALLPLVSPHGQVGFVAFDSGQLDLYGAIAQQVAAALNTARLYRAATEGRRLAEEASQMKSRFLSTVSHELRTPLNLIVGLSGMLLQEHDTEDSTLPETTRQDIERIHASAQHLGGLIGDVLDLASSEAGQLRLTNDFVDLSQALRMVAETGRQLAQAKGLGWQAHLPPTGPWVWGDRTRLRQVALNLVSNAVKFTSHGEVSLALETGPDTVTVCVRDSGLGVPPAEQQAIFTEFHRSTRTQVRGYGGLGLGLAICRRLVELHGGTLGVTSTGVEGAGSTFTFTLPTAPTPLHMTPPSPSPTTQPRILVVSSQPTSSQPLSTHLRRHGLAVETATLTQNGAWQAQLLTKPPSAVVLDISQSDAQSWPLVQTIKENPLTLGLPVLIYAGTQTGGALLELDYLTKPIDLRALTHLLDQYWRTDATQPTRTVLVVDDDPATLDLHTRIVQSQSATNRVLSAGNGREALALLAREPVDLVLLDLLMPELDGFGVLEAMRAQPTTRSIPVIVVTGQTLTEEEMARLHQGVTTVLGKGLYSLEETVAHLEAALERKRKLSSEGQRLVRKAMAYLHEHYTEPVSRQTLARHVGMAEDYLTHCFRQELGMTPVAYLTRYRITKAKGLLKTTAQSITAIALAVGFTDSGYFSRVFRREVGVAPEVFRRQP